MLMNDTKNGSDLLLRYAYNDSR